MLPGVWRNCGDTASDEHRDRVVEAVIRDGAETSFVEMGGRGSDNLDYLGSDENAIRGFWKAYRDVMGFGRSSPDA